MPKFETNLEEDIKELVNPNLLNSYEDLVKKVFDFIKDEYLLVQKKIAGKIAIQLLMKSL